MVRGQPDLGNSLAEVPSCLVILGLCQIDKLKLNMTPTKEAWQRTNTLERVLTGVTE